MVRERITEIGVTDRLSHCIVRWKQKDRFFDNYASSSETSHTYFCLLIKKLITACQKSPIQQYFYGSDGNQNEIVKKILTLWLFFV